MKNAFTTTLLLVFALFFLASCQTAPDPVPKSDEPVADEPVAEEASQQPAEEEAPAEEAVPEEPAEAQEEPQPVEVSAELYEKTFDEVEAVINELNTIVREKDFSKWLTYLTQRYSDYYSNPTVLAQQSQRPVLERNEIVLESIEDYFTNVFVPSRANLRLDDIVFLSDNTVEAIMVIDEQRYVLYLLKQVDDRWKIDTF